MELKNPAAPSRLSFRQAFRPFWITLAFSLVYLDWDYNRRHGPSTYVEAEVRIDGAPAILHTQRLVERPILESLAIPVGWREVEVSAPDSDSIFTNVFVWYGKNDLGRVELDRSRGKLQFEVAPRPLQYYLTNRFARYRTPTGFFSNIPAGEYEAIFEYSREIIETRRVRVVGHDRRTIPLINPVGRIEVSALGPGGEYVLDEVRGSGHWSGTLPLTVAFVRDGKYLFRAHRGEYRLEREILVRPGETNSTQIEFAYGGIEIETVPAGASVEMGGNGVGTTPLSLSNLIPGRYSMQLTKDGFDSVQLEVVAVAKGVQRLKSSLTLTRYREAMELAKRARDLGRFAEAERELQEALAAMPGDGAASALLPATQAAALRERASQLITAGNLPEASDVLSRSAAIEPDAPELRRLRGEIARIRERKEREEEEDRKRRIQEAERQKAAAVSDAVSSVKTAIADGNLERARERLAGLRALKATHPDIPAMESQVEALERKQAAENARRQMEEQIAARRRELVETLGQAARRDEHQPVRTLAWRTTKTAQQVQSACEPKEGKGMDVYDLFARDYLITWRNGRPIPFIGTGVYIRFGAVTLAPGQTEVRALLYNLTLINGRPASDPDEADSTSRARNLHETLKKALGGDLEPLSQ